MNLQNIRNNPFPGIRSFEENESNLFFGREHQVEQVVSILSKTHFVALIGHSGSGKSSLIKAGVIPRIKTENFEASNEWLVSVFRPGDNPIESFLKEFTTIYNSTAQVNPNDYILLDDIKDTFLNNKNSLFDSLNKINSKPWLLVIDQFEELFRIHSHGEYSKESQIFIQFLLELINQKISKKNIYVILTMRSDFLDECVEFPGLINAINKGSFIIPKMSQNSLQDAIIKPIEKVGGEISEELVNRLLEDLGNKPDQLPVMQHALMRAWDLLYENTTQTKQLNILHYETIGTIHSALSIHAEEIYTSFSSEKQVIIEKLFKSLIDIGIDNKGVRRPTSISELLLLTSATESDLFEVINEFRKVNVAFLMPTESIPLTLETVIDISHESLMRVWIRLKNWVDEEVKSAELYLRLSKSAELYQQGKAGLWVNPELEIAVKWKIKEKPNSYWAERYNFSFERTIEFLDFCKKESDFKILNKEEKQKRELKRARQVVIFLSLASIISLLFLIISLNLRFQAEASEETAILKGNLVKEESKKAEKQRREAIAQKRIAEQQHDITEQQKIITEEQRQYAVLQQNIAKENEIKAKKSESKALDSESKAKKAENESRTAEKKALIAEKNAQQSEKNTKRLHILATARAMAIQSTRITTVNNELSILLAKQAYTFTLENNGIIDDPIIFNALSTASGAKEKYNGPTDLVREITITDNGLIYSCGDDGHVYVWDSKLSKPTPTPLNTLNIAKNGLRCISSYNNSVTVGTTDGALLFWNDTKTLEKPIIINAHNGIIIKAKFITNNKIVTIGADGFIKIWDINNSKAPLFNEKIESPIKDITISENKKKLAIACDKGLVKIFNLENNTFEIQLQTKLQITTLAFDLQSHNIALGDANGTISFWNLETKSRTSIEFSDHKSAITVIEFSPDKTHFVSSSYDNTVRIWNLSNPKQNPIILSDHDSWVMSVTYSKRGDFIVSAGKNTVIKTTVDLDILSGSLCKKVSRNFTEIEWDNYIGKDIPYNETCDVIRK